MATTDRQAGADPMVQNWDMLSNAEKAKESNAAEVHLQAFMYDADNTILE